MLKDIYLIRKITSDHGTEGFLTDGNFFCKTLELPWRNNQQNISCIPVGEYKVNIRYSNKFGKVYWVRDVINRTYIYIHAGNVAGDVSKGYKSNVYGCILLGMKHGYLWNQRAVLNSRIAIRKFMNYMNYESFNLHIIGNQYLRNDYSRIMR